MKTRDAVTLIRQEIGPVSMKSASEWGRKFLGGDSGSGYTRSWSERELLAFYAYHSVKKLGGTSGTFQGRTARAILMGLPLDGAIWSDGSRFVACDPEEASALVFDNGGWALPLSKWRARVRRWMLQMGSPERPDESWREIVRDSLERQEIEKAMERHPSSTDRLGGRR